MELQERILALSSLGDFLKKDIYSFKLIDFKKIESLNPWFIASNVEYSIDHWSSILDYDLILKWIKPYNLQDIDQPKRVLLILAGNIPLVGFHDVLSVLVAGHNLVVKMAKKDSILLCLFLRKLCEIAPFFKEKIEFIDSLSLDIFDAVIATGSDNSEKYFEYYYKNKKRIIRGNKRSVSILSGQESKEELNLLADDIFMYFGLGCRNVSKVFVPEGYDLLELFNSFSFYNKIKHHKKYCNNYDYNKAMMLMAGHKLIENGFIIMKEDTSVFSPVAMLHYEFYKEYNKITDSLILNRQNTQCIVSKDDTCFGSTQKPQLWDYADGVDTLAFLKSL